MRACTVRSPTLSTVAFCRLHVKIARKDSSASGVEEGPEQHRGVQHWGLPRSNGFRAAAWAACCPQEPAVWNSRRMCRSAKSCLRHKQPGPCSVSSLVKALSLCCKQCSQGVVLCAATFECSRDESR